MDRPADALYMAVGSLRVERAASGARLVVTNAWGERVGFDFSREQAEQLIRELWAVVGGSFDPMADVAGAPHAE